jgi:acyl-CoA thioester hydrolase
VSSPALIPTFSTAVNTWQCDENNHLNVQFYTEFAHEASASLLAQLGFGPRAQRAAGVATRAVDDHVRYLREFRVVEPVEVHSAAVEVGERDLVAYHEVRNPAKNEVAATVRRRITCDRAWPADFRARAEAACVTLPETARPRSVGKMSLPDMHLSQAASVGLIEVGRTQITPDECDERGDFLPRHHFGRYSDGAPVLWNHLGFDRAAMQERQEGSVVVEMLNHYRAFPVRGGDRHACCLRRSRGHEVRPEGPQDHDVPARGPCAHGGAAAPALRSRQWTRRRRRSPASPRACRA